MSQLPSPGQPIRVRKPLPFDNNTGGRIIAKVCVPNRKPSPITGQKIGMPVAVQRPVGTPVAVQRPQIQRSPANHVVNRPVQQVTIPRIPVPEQRLVQPPVPKPRMVNRMVTPPGRPINVRPIRPPILSPVQQNQPIQSVAQINHAARSPVQINQPIRSPVMSNPTPSSVSPKKVSSPDATMPSPSAHPKGSLFAKGFKAINIGKNIVVKTAKPKLGQLSAKNGQEGLESPTAPTPSPVTTPVKTMPTEPVKPVPVYQSEPVEQPVTMTVPAQRFSQPVTSAPSHTSKPVVKAVTSVVRAEELTKEEKSQQPVTQLYQPVQIPQQRPAAVAAGSPISTPVKAHPIEPAVVQHPISKPRPKVVHQKYPPPVPVEGLSGANKGLPAIKTIKMANGETCGIKVQSPSVFAKVNLSTAKLREVKQQIAIQEAQKKKQRTYRVVKPPVRPVNKPEPTAVTVSVEDPNNPKTPVSRPLPKSPGLPALPAPVAQTTNTPGPVQPPTTPNKPVSLLAKYGGQIVGTAKLKNDKLKSPVQRVISSTNNASKEVSIFVLNFFGWSYMRYVFLMFLGVDWSRKFERS